MDPALSNEKKQRMERAIDYAKQYLAALQQLAGAAPRSSRAMIPQCIVSPSFLITAIDPVGRCSLELKSRTYCPVIHINGDQAFPASDTDPGLIVSTLGGPLDDFLFPGIPHATQAIFNVETHIHLIGLTFASTSFKASS